MGVFFEVVRPTTDESPLVVEVPHASVYVDPVSMAKTLVPARCIGQDADLYVDELYDDAPRLGATMLIARISRYVCDLNRAESDVDSHSVEGADRSARSAPHGLIWRQSTDGLQVLSGPLRRSEFERRLMHIYRPYHAQLQVLLDEKVERFGYAVLLAAHSMPSSGRVGHNDPGSPRADVVPGSRGRTTAAARVIDCPDRVARERGWSVAHDIPYRGGFTTGHYGRPGGKVHAIQIELNRRLYMNEPSLERLPGQFEEVRGYCKEVVEALSGLSARDLGVY